MTLAKKFGENRLTIIGTAILFLFLGAGLQSGIFSSREAMEQFLRQTGVLAPLCFLLLQTIQVVIPVVPGGVSCIIGVAMFGPLYGFRKVSGYGGKRPDLQQALSGQRSAGRLFFPGNSRWRRLLFLLKKFLTKRRAATRKCTPEISPVFLSWGSSL